MEKPILIKQLPSVERVYDNKIHKLRKGLYKCVCGKEFECLYTLIKRGIKKSCGCINKNRIDDRTKGELYSIYYGIKCRCYNKNNHCYKKYGAKGIKMDKKWLGENGYVNFVQDIGLRPSKECSVERIDNNKGYGPENCRWATPKEQGRNKTSNMIIEWNDKKQCLSMWSEELGIHWATIRNRIVTYKWSIEKALTEPVKIKKYNANNNKSS